MASFGHSSDEEDESHLDYFINAVYDEVIAREGVSTT